MAKNKLCIASWNINGLNAPIIRSMCLDWLKRHSIDVAFIQESHFKHSDMHRHYYTSAAATFNSKSCGPLVVLRRSLSLTIVGSYKIAFLCIYASNNFSPEFFGTISKTLYDLQDFSVIIGADMNAVLDPLLDRSSLIDNFSLTDLYRAINPSLRQYSLYSFRHKTYSRIDHLLASATSYTEIHSAAIHPNSLSDHCVVTAQLTLSKTPTKARRWRFNITLLKNNDYCDHFRNHFKTFISENANSVEEPRVLWGAIKGFVRNITISFASHVN
uniref:exodeoxyribonuclease III n=1 Tax=Fundulus heteroclitus TaxID=8078 RepID=A0A3Q2U9Z3_FUNHE